jgi:hypothetical protein
MKNYIGLLVFFTFFISIDLKSQSQDVIYPSVYDASAESSDPDLKNLQWNRYTTENNIVILSIDNQQGKWLSENIENIKYWCLNRWGFPESIFTKECRIFCVPDKKLFKRLFNLEQSKFEIRDDVTAVWVLMDKRPDATLPPLLTQISPSEFEIKNDIKFGWWFKRGSSQINGIISDIKNTILSLKEIIEKDQPIFVSEKMFTMTEEDYFKESLENQKIFDQQSLVLAIMLRKEFGEAKLQGFLRIASKNDPQDVLKFVYGFDGYEHFDKQYIRFMTDLASDVSNKKTPESYLEINSVR